MKFSKSIKTYIVIPEAVSSTEKFAAEELQKYLFKIFALDAEITKSAEGVSGNIISVGGPERNAYTAKFILEAEFDKTVPGPEGMFIKTYGDTLVLAGTSKCKNDFERGTLYAVYELLERYLGASLSAYTRKGGVGGEFVPKYDEFDVGEVYYVKEKADVSYRAACAQYDHAEPKNFDINIDFFDWLGKNRYNHIYTWCGVYEFFKETGLLEEIIKRGIIVKVGHHDSLDMILPEKGNKYFPEHYRETHPEYFRLNEDGTRFTADGAWGQMVLCSRNEELIKQLAKNLITWFKLNPQVKVFALCNKDGTFPQCCCEACKPYSKVENYAYMINEVAKIVGKELPDVRIDFIVYTDLWAPPADLKMEKNVAANEATWHITGLRKIGKPDGSCLQGTFFEENLLKWKALGLNVTYYDYFMGVYPGRQRWVPFADEMQAMCRRFCEVGIDGTESQIELYNLWNNIFNHYTFGRTAYDTSLSMEDNLLRFTRIFGEGAEEIADIIRYGEEVLDGQCEIMTAGVYLMNNIDKARVYEGFERALKKASTPEARNNIRLMRMMFRYSDIETREDYTNDERGYRRNKIYTIPERGELLYMARNFDTYNREKGGYGIMIAVDGEDNGFTPDVWYEFEE